MVRRTGKRVLSAALAILVAAGQMPMNVKAAGNGIELTDVNFPDAEFLQRIADSVDTNHDNTLSEAEVAACTALDFTWSEGEAYITDLTGIGYLTELESLNINNHQLTELNLNKNSKLKNLSAANNQLQTIRLDKCTAIECVDVSANELSSLKIASAAMTELNFSNNEIAEYSALGQTALEKLIGENNQLDTLNLSGAAALKELDVSDNNLSTLMINSNTALENIDVSKNQLTRLYAQLNTALTTLTVSANVLEELDISGCTSLENLDAAKNQLQQLDVSSCTALKTLKLSQNQLEELALAANTALETVDVSHNQLEALDVSLNTNISTLYTGDNRLPFVSTYDNGSAITELVLGSQELLLAAETNGDNIIVKPGFQGSERIQNVTGSGISYNETEKAFIIGELVPEFGYEYNVSASRADHEDSKMTVTVFLDGIPTTAAYFPDSVLLDYVKTEIDIDGNGYLNQTEIESCTSIELSDAGLKDLTGISYFTELETLIVNKNSLTALPISGNTALKNLDASENKLLSLNINKNLALETIKCAKNDIRVIDLSAHTALAVLDIRNNKLAALDISNNENLIACYADANQLSELGLSKNTKLEELTLSGNNIKVIDVNTNTQLTKLDVSNNQLKLLDVSGQEELSELSCGGNHLPYIKVYDSGSKLTSLTLGTQTTIGTPETLSGGGRYVSLIPADDPATFGVAAADTGKITLINNDHDFKLLDLITSFSYEYQLCGSKMSVTVAIDELPIDAELIPDDALRGYVAEQLDTDETGYLNEQEIAAAQILIAVPELESDLKIKNLDGLEIFTNLNTLDVSKNALEEIDLTKFPQLEVLRAGKNQLGNGSIKGLAQKALVELSIPRNLYTTIDLTKNAALKILDVSGNDLSELFVHKNVALEKLLAADVPLTGINLRSNTKLITLDISNIGLKSVDLAANTKLEVLNISGNELTDIDVSENKKLIKLIAANNHLEILDISSDHNKLEHLDVAGNQISQLNLVPLSELNYLDISHNQFQKLDIGANVKLLTLAVSNNELKGLDVSMLPLLNELKCSGNALKALDLTNCVNLTVLECADNCLPYIRGVADGVSNLTLGNQVVVGDAVGNADNPAIWEIAMNDMPQEQQNSIQNLNDPIVRFDADNSCFLVDMELPEFSYTVAINSGEMHVTFSTNAVKIETAFPDQALQSYIKSDAVNLDGNDYLTQNEISIVESLDISGLAITELTGLELFTELTSLDCSANELTQADFSSIPSLKKIYINDNQLVSITTEGCLELEFLACQDNQLESLKLSGNPALQYLNCGSNNLIGLSVEGQSQLLELDCGDNQLTSLPLNKNLLLEQLDCSSNRLSTLNLTKNVNLHELSAADNQLAELNVSKNTMLTKLDITENKIKDIDISQNTKLSSLLASSNQLAKLSTSSNTELEVLACEHNRLEHLNLTNNIKLKSLLTTANQLETLDISSQPDLEKLTCAENQLEELELINNNKMTELECQDNQIKQLDLTNQQGLLTLNCSRNCLKEILLYDQLPAENANIILGSQQVKLEMLRNQDDTKWETLLGITDPAQVSAAPAEGNYDISTGIMSFDRVLQSFTYTCISKGYEMDVEVITSNYRKVSPVVDAVVITPGPETTAKTGETITFTAVVSGANHPGQEVAWKLSGQTSKRTYISGTGMLKIGDDETAKTLTITCSSLIDTNIFAATTVKLTYPAPKILSVAGYVIENNKKTTQVYVLKGQQKLFYATVSGSGSYDDTVVWSVSGNKKGDTRIDSNGILYLSPAETAKSITVTATAKGDKNKTAAINVNVMSVPPTVGKQLKFNQGSYQVTKAAKVNGTTYTIGTVKFLKPTAKKTTSINIPDTIEVDGITYQVTEIEAGAFKNNKKVTTIKIGSNVSKIGKQAFYGCKKLKNLSISSLKLTAKTVGKESFTGTHKDIKIVAPSKKLSTYKKLLKKAGMPVTATYSKK